MQYDDALHMMQAVGGSFIRSLAECYLRADTGNKARLREAFSHEFERYERLYAMQQAS